MIRIPTMNTQTAQKLVNESMTCIGQRKNRSPYITGSTIRSLICLAQTID